MKQKIWKKGKRLRKGCAVVLALAMMAGMVSGYKPPVEVNAKENARKEEQIEKVITKKRGATIYDLGEGKRRAEIYAGDVRFADEEGKLQDYDTSLVRAEDATGDYIYETAQSDKMSYFPEKISEETPVLTGYDRYEVSISSDTDKKGTKKSKHGKTDTEQVTDLYAKKEEKKTSIEYEGIWEDASLEYESTNDGLKESIVLEDASAPSKYAFVLSMKNCCIVTQKQLTKDKVEAKKDIVTGEGESLYLYDVAEKKLVGSLPAGYMVDAEGEYSDACTYSLKLERQEKNETDTRYMYEMVLAADKKYLQASERTYPVTIDPSVTWTSTSAQTVSAYVCKSSPNSNYSDDNTNILCVGKRSASSDVCRAYVNFTKLSSTIKDVYVEKATLVLSTVQANTSMSIYVRNVAAQWNEDTVTYNTQPKKTAGTLGSFTTTKSAETVRVSLDTDKMCNALRNNKSLYGFELTDSKNDSNMTSTKTAWVYNSVSVNSTKIPKLEVVYREVDVTTTPQLKYQVYDSRNGWSAWEEDGKTAGDPRTEDKLYSLKMDLVQNEAMIGSFGYRAYCEKGGWSEWKREGEETKKLYSNPSIKAIEMKVCRDTELEELCEYYRVYYRVCVKGRGWLGWARDGQTAGDFADGAYVQAVQAVMVPTLRHRRDYVVGVESDTLWYYDMEYNEVLGDGAKTIGIGTYIGDEALRTENILETVAYTKNGEVKTKTSGRTYAMCSGTEDNYIVGFKMVAKNADLAYKYDVEHTVSASDSNVEEEEWKKNELVSGARTGGRPLEMFTARLVPKDFEEGERACYSDGFVVSEDGYAFGNSKKWYGYDKIEEEQKKIDPNFKYAIPLKKYVDIYGKDNGKVYADRNGAWRGSCFGMCFSALMFYNGYWDVSDYISGIDKEAQTPGRFYGQPSKKGRNVTDLIEYCQVSWYLYNANIDTEYGSTYEKYPKLIDMLQKMDGEYHYIMIMRSKDGDHAVIPLEIKELGNGTYEIQMYDVNAPCMISKATISESKFSYLDGYYNSARLLNFDKWLGARKDTYDKIGRLASVEQ